MCSDPTLDSAAILAALSDEGVRLLMERTSARWPRVDPVDVEWAALAAALRNYDEGRGAFLPHLARHLYWRYREANRKLEGRRAALKRRFGAGGGEGFALLDLSPLLVADLLPLLQEFDADALRRFYMEGWTEPELAALWAVPLRRARHLLGRARERLRRMEPPAPSI